MCLPSLDQSFLEDFISCGVALISCPVSFRVYVCVLESVGPGPALGEFGGEGAEGLKTKKQKATEEGDLLGEDVKPRAKLPPLLTPLCDLKAEKLHWLGVSFGLTSQLLNFWSRKLFKVRHVRFIDSAESHDLSRLLLIITLYC